MGSSCDFGLCINHGGNFKSIDNMDVYVGSHFNQIYELDRDRFGYFDLEEEVKRLGYVSWVKLWYKIPHTYSYRAIVNDANVMDMLEFISPECKILNVYVEGAKQLEDIAEKEVDFTFDQSAPDCSFGEGGSHQGDGEGVGGGPNIDEEESTDDDYNESESSLSDVSLADLDFVCDEEHREARRRLKDMRNIFDVIDDDDGFDVDLGVENGSEYSQSDGELHESDSEDDSYNPNKGRIVYNPKCDHRTLEIGLGMHFQDGYQCRRALTQMAIENGRFIRLRCVTAKRCLAWCATDCPWYVYGSIVSGDGSFIIKTYRGDHTCTRSMKNRLLTSRWIANTYANVFRVKWNMSVKDLRKDILHRFKTDVPKDRLYRGKKIAQELVRGSVEAHYASVRSYIAELRRVDTEGTYELLLGDGNVFKGMYMGLSALTKAFRASCRPVICLDGCHLKTYLRGILLCATGKDGNNGMFPIAWAVVEIENESCWNWFLKHLFHDLGISEGSGWTLISDQQKRLENAVRSLAPQAEHRNCARHVYMNWKKQHKGPILKNTFWRAVTSTYIEDFKLAVEDMKLESSVAFDDFMARDTKKFCKTFISTVPCCDAVDNNISETFNGFIVNARGKHLIHMFEEIRSTLMTRQVQKLKDMQKVNDRLCPKIREELERRRVESVNCISHPALGNKFEIHCFADKFVVNIDAHSCSCRVWELTGIPCIHAISAIQYLELDPAAYVNAYYTVQRYLSGYDFGIEPIRGQKMWPVVDGPAVKPPSVRRMAGRPKKKRIRAPEEIEDGKKLSKHGQHMTCSNCGIIGHNKRSCKSPAIQRQDVEKRRVGRPTKQNAPPPQNHRSTQHPSSSRFQRSITFRERGMARKGIGVYTSEHTGNVYYHSSMTQKRVVHVNKRATRTSSSTRQQTKLNEIPSTQESHNVDGDHSASTSGLQ